MAARKAKVLGELPDTSAFKDTGTYVMKDMTVDQYYY